MPKFRRVCSPSVDRTASYPYPSNSKNDEQYKPLSSLGSADDMKEWEEVRCPICMESPHNAVLLKCSSHEVGCRPYMCNTSYRHSNCLDQFCKSFASNLSSATLQEIPLTSTVSHTREVQLESGNPLHQVTPSQSNIICPLCRGQIHGYMVLEPARWFMNSKPRSCSSETCEFQGTYAELRKHARSEHPSVRPSEVDPSRMSDWTRMQQERGLEDFLISLTASSVAENNTETNMFNGIEDFRSFLTYIAEVLSYGARISVPYHDQRSATTHRVSNNTVTNQPARWRSSLPLRSLQHVESNHRGRRRTSSSSIYVESNRTARWRTNSSRMSRNGHDEHRDSSSSDRVSSTRPMPWASQVSQMSRDGHVGHRDSSLGGDRASSTRPMPWALQVSRMSRDGHDGHRDSSLLGDRASSTRQMQWTSQVSQMARDEHRGPSLSSGDRESSTRPMPWAWQVSGTNPQGNASSSGRVSGQQSHWLDQRWSTFNNQP